MSVSAFAPAGNHTVSSDSSSFDCSRVKSGETVTLESGLRGPLKIRSCEGTPENPIIIRNDPAGGAPTTIRRTAGKAGGFVFNCDNCIGVVIDGSYKWRGAPPGKTYGIKVTMSGGEAPSAFLRIGGISRFVTIRYVEVDGAWPRLASDGIGISINDHSIKRSIYPNLWREGYLIEHNYVHDVEGEGMYIGPNYRDGDLPLRNIEIRHNLVEDIGWEGINTKSMLSGNNSIHHNVVRRVGKNDSRTGKAVQYAGINNNTGTVRIYNNWVEDTGTHGIKLGSGEGPPESDGYGPFTSYVWNNVIVNPGSLWRPFMSDSHGISVTAQEGREKPAPHIYSNTVVNARGSGIYLSSNVAVGYVRDNIIAGAKGSAIQAPASVKQTNNRTGVVSDMKFVDPNSKNFRLRPESPARNRGTLGAPGTDFDDRSRPQDGTPDQGAFEFSASPAEPRSPTSLLVD